MLCGVLLRKPYIRNVWEELNEKETMTGIRNEWCVWVWNSKSSRLFHASTQTHTHTYTDLWSMQRSNVFRSAIAHHTSRSPMLWLYHCLIFLISRSRLSISIECVMPKGTYTDLISVAVSASVVCIKIFVFNISQLTRYRAKKNFSLSLDFEYKTSVIIVRALLKKSLFWRRDRLS